MEFLVARYGVVKDRGETMLSTSVEGARLVSRIRARDLRVFEELYRNYHPRLTRILTNLVQRPQIVEQVFNDTMLVVPNAVRAQTLARLRAETTVVLAQPIDASAP
jgi:hypothetical protein